MAEVNLVSIGIIAIIVGFILVIFGILSQSKGSAKTEGGGIVFIGPFLIGGATNERAFYILIAISVAFFILFFVMNYVRS